MTEQQFENILRQALCPDISPEETVVHRRPPTKGATMKIKSILKKTIAAVVAVMMLATTAYATDFMNIKTLATTGAREFRSEAYKDMDKAMKKAGFEINVPEEFENGYAFQNVIVEEVGAYDEHGEERFTYMDLIVNYQNAGGKRLFLSTNLDLENIPTGDRAPKQTRMVGDVQVRYQLDHYKFVPPDYQLTAEDEAMLEKPGYYLSYGSDTVQEQDNQSVTWVKDGVRYHLLDSGAEETPETLFAMAEALILAE